MPVALPAARSRAHRERRLTGRAVLLCLVGFFLVVAGANAVMITVAMRTFGGVRTESSYRAGQQFAAEKAAVAAQDALGWTVETELVTAASEAEAAAPQRTVTVTAVDASDRPLAGVSALVRLEHPADARRDIEVAMEPTAPGVFAGSVTAAHGQWDLVVELVQDGRTAFRSTRRVFAP